MATRLTTGAVVAAYVFKEAAELGYLWLQSVGLVLGDEYELTILDSVGGYATLYATVDDSQVLITSGNGVLVMSSTKSMCNASCIFYPE
jgi:hypothetical protein